MKDYSPTYLILMTLLKKYHSAALAGKTKDALDLSSSIFLVAENLHKISKEIHGNESRETTL